MKYIPLVLLSFILVNCSDLKSGETITLPVNLGKSCTEKGELKSTAQTKVIARIDGNCGECLEYIDFWNFKISRSIDKKTDTSFHVYIYTLNEELLKFYLKDKDISFCFFIDTYDSLNIKNNGIFVVNDAYVVNSKNEIVRKYF